MIKNKGYLTFFEIIISLILQILIALLFTLIFQIFNIKTIYEPCRGRILKFSGPYSGKVSNYEDDTPISKALVIFWWEKDILLEKGVCCKPINIYKTYTDEDGSFYFDKFQKFGRVYGPKYIVIKRDFIEYKEYLKLKKQKVPKKSFKEDSKCIYGKGECNFKMINTKKEGLVDFYRENLPEEINNIIFEEFEKGDL